MTSRSTWFKRWWVVDTLIKWPIRGGVIRMVVLSPPLVEVMLRRMVI